MYNRTPNLVLNSDNSVDIRSDRPPIPLISSIEEWES
jgi:hypothetical protein